MHEASEQHFSASIDIRSPRAAIWHALTDLEAMPLWMGEPDMKLVVATDWAPGAPFVLRGFLHEPFENHGRVLVFVPEQKLAYSHLSSHSNLPPTRENETEIEVSLEPSKSAAFSVEEFANHNLTECVRVTVRASNFPTYTIAKHLQMYWRGTLVHLKTFVESRSQDSQQK